MSEKLQRTITRFRAKINAGSYYEAHQTVRTITNRYVKAKQYSDAIDLLYQAASILAAKSEYASATDLIIYLLAVYSEAGITCDAAHKEYKMKLIELVSQLPQTDPALADLAKKATNWSQENTDNKFGDADLHHLFGLKFLGAIRKSTATNDEKSKLFAIAELHCVLGTSETRDAYCQFLYDVWAINGGDPGIFMARGVLNYGYLENVTFAQEFVHQFIKLIGTKEFKEEGEISYNENYPLCNFAQLLVLTLAKEEAGSKFLKLLEHYKPSLEKAQLVAPVEYLGKTYFQLKLGNTGGQNMFANMMGGLFK